MRCFSCGGCGHFSGQCRGQGLGVVSGRGRGVGGRKRAWESDQLDAGVLGVKRPRGGAFIVGGKRSAEFTLGPQGLTNEGVYVLQMPGGGFYVGKSGNVEERLRQHEGGGGAGAVCAKGFLRQVPAVTPRQADFESWERAETLTLMHRHGIGKVRGWFYTSPELTPSQREHAFQQVCEKFDLCRICGNASHFASQCAVRERAGFCFG